MSNFYSVEDVVVVTVEEAEDGVIEDCSLLVASLFVVSLFDCSLPDCSLLNCSLVEVEISWLVSSVDVTVEVEEELAEDCSLFNCSLFIVSLLVA
jgi:hypothetical protein